MVLDIGANLAALRLLESVRIENLVHLHDDVIVESKQLRDRQCSVTLPVVVEDGHRVFTGRDAEHLVFTRLWRISLETTQIRGA